MSDLFMTSNDGKYQILVEVKNVTTLSPTDKSKFINDIEISSKNGKINGAILYSMNNANINSRYFNIAYHFGIPTLYISNVKNNVEMIKYLMDYRLNINIESDAIYEQLIYQNTNLQKIDKQKLVIVQKIPIP